MPQSTPLEENFSKRFWVKPFTVPHLKTSALTWVKILLVVLVAFVSYRYFGLVYDEASNYSAYSIAGVKYTYTKYTANNHVLYGLLMALLPRSWVIAEPMWIRLPNLLIFFGLITLSIRYLMLARLTMSGIVSVLALLAILFVSPQQVFYYFVGRGHLLGCALVFWGIYLRQKKFKFEFLSDFVLALSSYAISTYNFVLPGVFFVDWISLGFKKAAFRAARTLAFILLLWGPNLKNLMNERQFYREYFKEIFFFPQMALEGATSFRGLDMAIVLGGALLVLWVYSIARFFYLRKKSDPISERTRIACYLFTSLLSFLCVVQVFNFTKYAEPPWQRNALFFSPFIVTGLFLLWDGWKQKTVLILCVLNAAFCLSVLRDVVFFHGMPNYPIQDNGGPSLITTENLNRIPSGSELVCASFAIAACDLYLEKIRARGFYLQRDLPQESQIKPGCGIGKNPPRNSVHAYYRMPGEELYQEICY